MRVAIEAHPNAQRERVDLLGSTLRVWVRARPVDGRANAAIERLVAKALGLRRQQVQIVGGATSRHKIVDLEIADLDDLRVRLLSARSRID